MSKSLKYLSFNRNGQLVAYVETVGFPNIMPAVNTEVSPIMATKPWEKAALWSAPGTGTGEPCVQAQCSRQTLGMWRTRPRQQGSQHADA